MGVFSPMKIVSFHNYPHKALPPAEQLMVGPSTSGEEIMEGEIMARKINVCICNVGFSLVEIHFSNIGSPHPITYVNEKYFSLICCYGWQGKIHLLKIPHYIIFTEFLYSNRKL